MNAVKGDYFNAYRSLKLTRDSSGVLVAEFHTKGGPFTFTAQDHTELVDAFYRIAQDRANKIVILTGAGGDFITGVEWSSFGNVADPGVWSQVHDEGVQILEKAANPRSTSDDGANFDRSRKETSCGGKVGVIGTLGGGFLIIDCTDSPLSKANAATSTSPATLASLPASVITTPS